MSITSFNEDPLQAKPCVWMGGTGPCPQAADESLATDNSRAQGTENLHNYARKIKFVSLPVITSQETAG